MGKGCDFECVFVYLFIVVESLEKSRQPLPKLEAIYIMVPSEQVH